MVWVWYFLLKILSGQADLPLTDFQKSETKPDQYRAFEYLEQWNASLLRGVTKRILKMKFPERKSETEK